jgi:hypothetical protein
MNEGTRGASNMEFTLSLSSALTHEGSVKITTKVGFAKAVEDYHALNQVVVFKAGETEKKVSVTIVADDLKEGIDEFQVLLSDAVKCTIFDGIGLCVINNDDTKIPVNLVGATHPFNEPFFFIINIAVGGNWPGSPNTTTYFPQWLYVDYIRVFQ